MEKYFLIYGFVFLISFSFIGYGYLLCNFLDKKLIKINIGYIGLVGLFFSTIISYFTIFFFRHGFAHNVIFHATGILSFIYFYSKFEKKFNLIKYAIIFSILYIGLLILRNHDDFNYYHLTYSLGLTQNKLILGLGNLGHGYKHHSSIFFLNSTIYLPFIKHYLFHSIGWLTLFYINLIFLEELFIKRKKIDFEFFFYLFSILFINFKFFKIGTYGTDISGQLIMICLLPLIYKLYKFRKIEQINKTHLIISILLITYVTTIKSFMVLNFLYLLPIIFFTKVQKLKILILPKTIAISLSALILLIIINISYTGCAIYPVKQTCFEKKFEWSLSKNHVNEMHRFYQLWSKAGAGINYKVQNKDDYIKNLNWVPNWYDRYFTYKFKETLGGMTFLAILVLILYKSPIKQKLKTIDHLSKRSLKIIFFVTILLFLEWFLYHPALRYGGYHLLTILFFLPMAIFLTKKNIDYKKKFFTTCSLVIFSFILFNYKNFVRIDKEFTIVKNHEFPFFYSPKQKFTKNDIGNNIYIFVPDDKKGCWTVKTPCTHYAGNVIGDSFGGFKMIKRKK